MSHDLVTRSTKIFSNSFFYMSWVTRCYQLQSGDCLGRNQSRRTFWLSLFLFLTNWSRWLEAAGLSGSENYNFWSVCKLFKNELYFDLRGRETRQSDCHHSLFSTSPQLLSQIKFYMGKNLSNILDSQTPTKSKMINSTINYTVRYFLTLTTHSRAWLISNAV